MSKGFFTIAQGNEYQRLAYGLALSLKLSQPDELSKLSIGVTKQEKSKVPSKYLDVFDNVIEIPWKDHAKGHKWKLQNEWKSIYMTPYDETIKLDADMLFLNDVSFWWDVLKDCHGKFATNPLTYRNNIITSDYYRKVFTENALPNIYTAAFYFKKDEENFELFKLAEVIFNNWEKFFYEYFQPAERPKFVSTDVVFALAAKILDYNKYNMISNINVPTFVHMKTNLQGWQKSIMTNEDWTKVVPHYFGRDCLLKIGNYIQTYPIHYYVKTFLTDDKIQKMERKLGI